MIAFIKQAIAVPIRLLAEAAGWVTIVDPTPLWSASWRLSHNPQDGCKLLVLVHSERGIEITRQIAEEMLDKSKDSELAAHIAFIELEYGAGIEEAKKWVKKARQGNFKNPEMLLRMELILSDEDNDESNKVAEQILARNDLPMDFTLAALTEKAWALVEEKQFSEAEAAAERMLAIEENYDARFVKWIVCMAKGQQLQQAKEHLKKAKGNLSLPEGLFHMIMARCCLILGRKNEAIEWLYEAEKAGFRSEESESAVGQLAHSEEFRRFCEGRENK